MHHFKSDLDKVIWDQVVLPPKDKITNNEGSSNGRNSQNEMALINMELTSRAAENVNFDQNEELSDMDDPEFDVDKVMPKTNGRKVTPISNF